MTYTSPTGKVYTDAREIAADLARHPGETWPIPPPLRAEVRRHLMRRILDPPKDTPRHVVERWSRHADHLHLQDPTVPRLVDGVWTTPADGLSVADDVMRHPPSTYARPFPCCYIPEEPPCSDPK